MHNKHVVESLKAKGAVFVEDVSEVPDNAVTIFSAHGVAKSVEDEAAARNLPVLNATCPLVTKVHNQGKRYVGQGRKLILIGHAGHPEVEGTMGQIPSPVILVQNEADVDKLDLPADTPVAYVTQTTLSVDDTQGIIPALQRKFTNIVGPETRDICYATQNRQSAVRDLSKLVDRDSGGRRDQQLEFQSPARDRRGSRPAELSDRRRQRARSEMARGREDGRSHRRRVRAGGAGRRCDRQHCGGWGRSRSRCMDGRQEKIEFRLPAELAVAS